jgi:protein involved in ribonucleotide reduction
MIIAYDSAMGKTERFVKKTGLDHVKISSDLVMTEPFVLVTYTTGRGEVPDTTLHFLKNNHEKLLAVAATGHPNWGEQFYARSGDIIAARYGVPLIAKITMSGYDSDVNTFKEGVSELYVGA